MTKLYQNLVVADFAGMTVEQIHDVLIRYESDAETNRRVQDEIDRNVKDYINRNY